MKGLKEAMKNDSWSKKQLFCYCKALQMEASSNKCLVISLLVN